MFLNFKFYLIHILLTANTPLIPGMWQVLGQIISMLTHLIIKLLFVVDTTIYMSLFYKQENREQKMSVIFPVLYK